MKEFLSLVSKPVRYLGNEINSIKKDPKEVKLRFCLAFPDVYEVGMSHLGIQILYAILNSKDGVACERTFAPWVDMEKILREKGVPLCSLESSTPLNQFDILGFSLQYELCFTNVLNMLNLSHIPLFAEERDERFPLIIAGGPSALNPTPISDFFDAIAIGDGEEVVLEICDVVLHWKEAKGKKVDLLKSLSQLHGLYVPYVHSQEQKIQKRLVSDLNWTSFPTCPIIPFMRVVHDRLNIEIARGCKRGCRFCEAGFIYRPYRERNPEVVHQLINSSLKKTGYEEVSLLALSAGDYLSIGPLISILMNKFEPKNVAVSFPSLRIESIVGYLAEEVSRVRKTGFTIAPEAGTDRLRKVINKEINEEVLFHGLEDLFSKGWRNVKLYFMIGLPTEKEEDLRGIIELSKKISSLGKRQKVYPNVSVSISTFVPKPHTPFQWASQISLEEMKERLSFLRNEIKRNHLHFKWQNPHLSFLEGIFSRGDRNLSRVLIEANQLGCRFDGWSDQFNYSLWEKAFEKTGLEMESYTKKKEFNETLPWSFIDTGIDPTFLWQEFEKGLREEVSPPCVSDHCYRCGVCNGDTIRVHENLSYALRGSERIERERIRKNRVKRRVRLRFTKQGEMRFLSHLELAHLFYRALKRADLLLSHSKGFHPMPRIVFASALPVGVESLTEIVDIELEDSTAPREIMDRLNLTLPPGIEIIGAEELLFSSRPSPLVRHSVYWISLDHHLSKEEIQTKIKRVLGERRFVIQQERKGERRTVDIRPLIESLEVKDHVKGPEEKGHFGIEIVLRNDGRRTAKPSEIIEALLGLEGEALARCRIIKLE